MNPISKTRWMGNFVGNASALSADDRGVSAIEFALVLPFLLFLYFGGVEVLQGITINREVGITATTVANIVTQYTTISSSEQMPDILEASAQILAPYASSNVSIVVSLITIDSNGKATVTWSQTLNGTVRPTGQVVTVPASLDVANTTLVFSEAAYTYTPIFDFMHLGTSHLYSSMYMVPRDSTTINLAS